MNGHILLVLAFVVVASSAYNLIRGRKTNFSLCSEAIITVFVVLLLAQQVPWGQDIPYPLWYALAGTTLFYCAGVVSRATRPSIAGTDT